MKLIRFLWFFCALISLSARASDTVTSSPETSNPSNLNPGMASLWDSTLMVFGAANDGVGIGTSFALKKAVDGKMIFVTSFHVVEQFCEIPEKTDADLVSDVSGTNPKYPCQALYVLHDLAIDTQSHNVVFDGAHPWKAEVLALDYFDKSRDLAAFRVSIPGDSDLKPVVVEGDFDLKNLLIVKGDAQIYKSNAKPKIIVGKSIFPLTSFPIYMVAVSVPNLGENENTDALIKKHWYKGSVRGVLTFENDKKLGFVSALKHDMEALPGTSGAPVVLSDGRVVGVNSSAEVKNFYESTWWILGIQELATYKSYFAMPTTYVKEFLEKLN